MELIRKNTPVGLDLEIDKIQLLIYTYLTTNSCVKGDYSDYVSYNRAYKNVYEGENKNGVFAERFFTGNDYKSVFTDDNIAVSSFFIANNNEDSISRTRKKRTISLIFQINLKKVYATLPHRADEEFHNELRNALIGLKKPSTVLDGINGIDNVYTEFEISKLKKKNHDLQPYHVFRQDIEVQYDYDCCPTFASIDCTIGVTVEAIPETSLNAGDGMAIANITGDQGNITYLWTTSNGSIPAGQETNQTITGLIVGDYSVLVTDDNILIPVCSATSTGSVEAGEPLPPCMISIDSITTTGTVATESNGTATATVSGNEGGINFFWQGQNGYTSTSNPAVDIPSGKLTLTVSDSGVGVTCVRGFCTEIPIANGNALSFKGDGDHVEFTPIVFGPNKSASIQIQFYADSLTGLQILVQGDNIPDPEVIALNGDNQITVRLSTTTKVFSLQTDLIPNTWNLLHLVLEEVSGKLRLYMNSELSTIAFTNITDSWDFRYLNDGAGISFPFEGLMDNIHMIKDYPMTITEVVECNENPSLFQTIVGPANVAYLCNQTGATTTLNDDSANNNDGTMDGLIAEPFVPHV